jgi:hypothetical protein
MNLLNDHQMLSLRYFSSILTTFFIYKGIKPLLFLAKKNYIKKSAFTLFMRINTEAPTDCIFKYEMLAIKSIYAFMFF